MKLFALLLPAVLALPVEDEFETITFPSKDGLEITADLYAPHEDPKTPFVVLFHQANWSRGEYREIAPKLTELGFNCMAVDQRSGKSTNGVANETAKRAAAEGKASTYVDALPDLVASIEYARAEHAKGEVIAWGSSYSAALVLRLAGDRPKLADGVLSFAPGEYFSRFGKTDTWIQEGAKGIRCPVFITSAKKEEPNWSAIYATIPGGKKASFVPKTTGNHGSRALYDKYDDSEAYWKAVEAFLDEHFPRERE